MLAAAGANTILNLAAFIAFERIGIGLTLLVFYLYPAGVAIVSTIWFGERLDRLRWSALVSRCVGMALVVAGAGTLGELDLVGIGLAFAGGDGAGLLRPGRAPRLRPRAGPQAAAVTMGGAALAVRGHRRSSSGAGSLGQPLASRARRWCRSCSPASSARACRPSLSSPASACSGRRGRDPRHAGAGGGLGAGGVAARRAAGPVQLVGGVLILVAAVLLQLGRGTAASRARGGRRIAENAVRSATAAHRTVRHRRVPSRTAPPKVLPADRTIGYVRPGARQPPGPQPGRATAASSTRRSPASSSSRCRCCWRSSSPHRWRPRIRPATTARSRSTGSSRRPSRQRATRWLHLRGRLLRLRRG